MIDPSIALSYKPVQLQDPVQGLANVQAFQAGVQQQKLGAQQLKAATTENAMRDMQLKDQQSLRDAWSESNGDGDKFFQGAVKRGVSPMTLQTIRAGLLEQRQKGATLEETTRKNMLARNTALQSRLAPIVAETDPAKQQALWAAGVQQAVAAGDMTPDEAQQHGAYPGAQGVHDYVAGLNFEKWTLGEQQQATAAQRQGAANKDAAEIPGLQAKSAGEVRNGVATRLINAGPDNFAGELMRVAREHPELTDLPTKYDPKVLSQYGMNAEQIANANRADAAAEETKNYHKQEIGLRSQEVAISGQRAADEHGKRVFDQGAMQAAAHALASGDLLRLKDIASLRGDQRLQLYYMAKQENPKLDLSDIDRKIKNEDYYANGKGADSLRSFNTFLEHAGQAADSVAGIRLSNTPAINKPLNWWRSKMSGSPEYQQLVTALEPVRKEYSSFLLSGHALEKDDRESVNTILSDNSSPAQIEAALKQMGHTATARVNEENFRYKKVSGHDLEGAFSPEAAAGAARIGAPLPGWAGAPAPGAPSPQSGTSSNSGTSGHGALPPVTPGRVRLQAPDGSVSDVLPEAVSHYLAKGAKRL